MKNISRTILINYSVTILLAVFSTSDLNKFERKHGKWSQFMYSEEYKNHFNIYYLKSITSIIIIIHFISLTGANPITGLGQNTIN